MKKYFKIILAILLSAGILSSCKKDSTPASKDYAASIKDKTWSGAITYTGKITEYYSVHFNADNTLDWSQLSGTYTGHWIINAQELTLSFDANTVQIKAGISNDNTLMNITDNTGAYEINSGGMIANPAVPLNNTVWKGSRTNTVTATTLPYQMSFMSGPTVEIKIGNTVLGTSSYSRQASGAAIRVTGGYFGVLMPSGEMKGSDSNAAFPWQVIKQ